jgi:Peptidoglycan-binding protein, CsiV
MHKLALFLLPLLAINAAAQQISDEQPADVRRYTVEMIIFAYADTVSAGSEIFVPDLPPEAEIQALDEFGVVTPDALQSSPDIAAEPIVEETAENAIDDSFEEQVPFEIVMLPEDEFSLDTVYEHLDRLDAYRPLLHFGWTQPTYADRLSKPRPLSSFVTPPEGLAGELNLYLSRYLHLVVNLELGAPSTNATFDTYRNDYVLDYPVRYRINEDRIFRNGELRYFDHPRFGVLAKITRVEEGDDEPDETELLGYGPE